MLRNFLKITFRNLYKNPFFTVINIAGLAVGMTCVLFIIFFVKDELSFDRHSSQSESIYRMYVDARFMGKEFITAMTGGPIGPGYKNEFPEILDYVRIMDDGLSFIEYEKISYKEPRVFFADSNFFKFFSLPLVRGNVVDVLNSPDEIAISEKIALKYFGSENPVGKILRLDEKTDYTISGVFKNFPENSHFHMDFVGSICSKKWLENDQWTNANVYTYVLLNDNCKSESIEDKYQVMLDKYIRPEVESFGVSIDDFLKSGNRWDFKFQPLTDIHLHSNLSDELEPNGSIEYVYIFSAIGIFILLLASINFINLSTARSASRAKEVGIKKVVGSLKTDLIMQFLSESICISVISLLIALGIVELLLPYFNELVGKNVSASYFTDLWIFGAILTISVLTGLLAGSFPAFVFSSFKPVDVLKGNLSSGIKKGWLRSGLVVFQFSISIVLIIGTMIVFNQLNYIQNRNLGFDKEQRVIIDDAYILGKNLWAFKEEVRKLPDVQNITVSGYLPVDSYRNINGTFPDGDSNSEALLPMQSWRVDSDYIETMGMELVKGRNFSPLIPSDSNAVIINESCAKHFGWENPLEHRISRGVNIEPLEIANYNVIGVVKDFHYESLKNKIEPLVIYLGENNGFITLRIKTKDIPNLIDNVKENWNKLSSDKPFSYRFMDESFDKIYSSEQRIGRIFTVFAGLAILIGCLGLFALSAYTAERKTKEIGIRRVLGGSIQGMVFLLSREFIKLVLISYIISAPLAYLLMNKWLEDYAYRTEVGLGVLLYAGIISLFIALVTVSYHAIKAAVVDPAKSLKYE